MPQQAPKFVDFAVSANTTDELVQAFRQKLGAADQILRDRYDAGEGISVLVKQRSQVIDQLLVHVWQHLMPDMNETGQCALIAVGGYGRGELHPQSDIDIMTLLPEGDNRICNRRIERFVTFLWDIGLEVGHSTRTVAECIEQSEKDVTVATNLMEARLLQGPADLFEGMRKACGPHNLWPSRDFFEAKWQEQIARHRKFHDVAYNLEPNIKEGPGGLRDIQMVGWVAKRHFGADNLHDLVGHGFLTEQEYERLIAHQEFLWRIRMALHYLTGRREDRLLFDYQTQLAAQFGYQDTEHQLAVEQFMKRYYRTIGELDRLNEMLLQLFQEAILYADEPGEPVPINKRFQSRKGFVEVKHANVFERYPFALLEVFLILAQHPKLKGVRAETIRLIRSHLRLIDVEFRNDLRCRSLFMEFMRQPHGITHELRRMHRYGVLGAYIPLFGNIIGQMQYDLFHVYSVDEHTLFVVRNLRRFALPQFQHEFPQCSAIFKRLPKPELLYLAGMFHDIGKGRGGDHSELGAVDALQFCLHHGMSDYDAQLVSWLVNHHLIMSMTAQRKDIGDPDVILSFAVQVGNQTRLDYLYLLTVADIRATNPELWNSWKAALLSELYAATRHTLRRGLGSPVGQTDTIRESQREARLVLHDRGLTDEHIDRFWQDLSDEYFMRYAVSDICLHTEAILNTPQSELPLVILHEPKDFGGTAIFIHTPMDSGLFATVTATLDQLGLTIVDARIIPTRTGYTMDTYIVLEASGEAVKHSLRITEIGDALKHQIVQPDAGVPMVSRRIPRQLKHFPIATEVQFSVDEKNQRTVMEVITSDRPGLLANIGGVLQLHAIRIQNAKIATIGSRAEDIFFVTDDQLQPLSRDQQDTLRTALMETLADD